MWALWIAAEAAACGGFSLKDLERGVRVSFLSSSVNENGPQGSVTVMRLGDTGPGVLEWSRTDTTGVVPPSLRWEWSVDVGDALSMDGTLLLRDQAPVGEWLGADLLRLGDSEYTFVLAPSERDGFSDIERWYKVAVSREGKPVAEGVATSLCLGQLVPDDEQREIRTRVAYWLAQTRKPEPLAPLARRLPAQPSMLSSPEARIPLTATASTELSSGGRRYGASLLTDGDRSTAWCEGDSQLGIGATVTLELAEPTDPVLELTSGYAKDAYRLLGNGQPRRLLVTTDTGEMVEISLPYGRDPARQDFRIPLAAPGTTRIELELVEAWPGERWADTCISELGVSSAR